MICTRLEIFGIMGKKVIIKFHSGKHKKIKIFVPYGKMTKIILNVLGAREWFSTTQ